MATLLPKSPGELLDELIHQKDLTQQEAADLIGISRQYLNGIVNGKYPFTAELCLKLAEPLGSSPDFWMDAMRAHEEFMGTPEGIEKRAKADRESLLLELELQGARSLVDHQIHAAIEACYLQFQPSLHRERVRSTCCLLGFGLKGHLLSASGVAADPVSTKPGFKLKRGETVSLSTLEKISIPSRMTARVLGLSEMFAEKCLLLSCQPALDPGFSNHLTFSLTNLGPYEVKIMHGEPCLALAIEFLAQEPAGQS